MRGIAAEAGVTTGFVTHYFEDKQELLAEVIRYNNLRARDRVMAAIGDHRGLVALEGAVDASLPIDADRGREWQVWIASWRPGAAGGLSTDELRGGRRFVERLLAGLLAQAIADGDLPATFGRRLRGRAAADHDRRRRADPRRRDAGAHASRRPKRMLAEQLASLERPQPEAEEMHR